MAKAKRSIKDALGASVTKEASARKPKAKAFEAKLAKAEAIHGGEASPHDEPVVRDTFSMPASDYALIRELNERALKRGIATNKSALVRAGLRLLRDLGDAAFDEAVSSTERMKPGRRRKADRA